MLSIMYSGEDKPVGARRDSLMPPAPPVFISDVTVVSERNPFRKNPQHNDNTL
jgi:hypothetical protein